MSLNSRIANQIILSADEADFILDALGRSAESDNDYARRKTTATAAYVRVRAERARTIAERITRDRYTWIRTDELITDQGTRYLPPHGDSTFGGEW